MDDLISKVLEWKKDKNINNPDKQCLKIMEELGELASRIVRNDYNSPEVVDALGDIMVTLAIEADILGFDIKDCLQEAYGTIKGRTGKTVDGSFIKDNE